MARLDSTPVVSKELLPRRHLS